MHIDWKCFWRCRNYKSCFPLSRKTKSINQFHNRTICSTLPTREDEVSKFEITQFSSMLKDRRKQAQSSIIVKVKSYHSLFSLHTYMKQFAKIKKIFYRKLNSEKEYFLIECDSMPDVKSLLQQCKYFKTKNLHAHSRCLIFDGEINKIKSLEIKCDSYDAPLENIIYKRLHEADNIKQQMIELQRLEQLSDFDTRLRFFVCSQIEECLPRSLPLANCIPFGSAVNGFGCLSGDLDMNLNLNIEQDTTLKNQLYFIPKETLLHDRLQLQRMLESLGNMLQTFAPNISDITRILNARIPILKFNYDLADLQCDLSMNNMSGIYMAELLYIYAELDCRVRPLVSTVRKWAKKNKLTSDIPSSQITNFSLILLVIFFLQNHPKSSLPSITYLLNKQIEEDNCSDDNTMYNLSVTSNSETSDLDLLLKEFFEYYANFNYKEHGMSLLTGNVFSKNDNHFYLYIQNPMEAHLNVSKNVHKNQLIELVTAMRKALWKLENHNRTNKSQPWGLLNLFVSQDSKSSESNGTNKFQVKNIFDEYKNNAKELYINNKFIYESNSNTLPNHLKQNKLVSEKLKKKY